MAWIGLMWLRIGTSEVLLWTRWRIFGFNKMLGSSWVAAQLAASQGGLSSVSIPYHVCWEHKDRSCVDLRDCTIRPMTIPTIKFAFLATESINFRNSTALSYLDTVRWTEQGLEDNIPLHVATGSVGDEQRICKHVINRFQYRCQCTDVGILSRTDRPDIVSVFSRRGRSRCKVYTNRQHKH
jgi:hypothetical protein